jgi:type IV secretory pathway VirB2 component (pilin)
MLGRALAISLATSVTLLIVLLQTTTPATIGPLGILLIFVLMYLSVLCVLTFLLFAISGMVAKVSSSMTLKRPLQQLSLRRSYYFASVVALAPVILVGMQSVGEVSFYDVLLIVVFIVISCVYIAKRSA